MSNNFFIKYKTLLLREYIFIFLSATIFLFTIHSNTLAEENIFTIDKIEVEGIVNLNFSREKYLNKAFSESFGILMSKILLSGDLNKVKQIKLKKIKKLISSFQILEEVYIKDDYKISIKVLYNETKVKKFLAEKNISFTQPQNITVLFYPVFFINNEIQNLNENIFYKNWSKIKIKNNTINFILPLEDLDDVSRIVKMKNKIEELNIENLVNKYDIENYVFSLIDYNNQKLNIYLKLNLNNKKISKNLSYDIKDVNDELLLSSIIKDIKLNIVDLWKRENLINLLMPLSIQLKFNHKDMKNLDNLKEALDTISIINSYTLEEFNINNSFFKIYYYGDPKKFKSELLSLGYSLENIQGSWQLYLNE